MAKNYRPIPIPDGVQLTVKSGQLDVKGKLGALSVSVIPRLEVKSDGKEVSVAAGTGVPRAQVGTLRALLRNAFTGVSQGFEKGSFLRGAQFPCKKETFVTISFQNVDPFHGFQADAVRAGQASG